MSKSAIITLTTAGTDTGPFNLLSDVDSYATPFETNIAKSSLIAGYTTNSVPDAATIVRVQSSSSLCTNFINLIYPASTTTTTTTTSTTTSTTTAPPTTTTTTTSTTTTTTTAGTGSFTVKNTTGSGQIDDVTTTGGAYFYFFNTGNFPITAGQQADGGGASLTSSPVFVDISNFSSTSCLSLYINGGLSGQLQVSGNGTYTFTNQTFTTSDVVLIEYVSGICP
jgi:hypothetical protein